MAKDGSKTKQRRGARVRLGFLLALFATAALAPGLGAHGHPDNAPGALHVEMAVMPGGGGSIAGHAGGDFSGHAGTNAAGHQKHVPGAGAGPQGDADGLAPNGENGLILLADLPQGGVPGAGEGPTGGDNFQTAENNSGGEGFGGGAGGGSGGGSGGGGGGFTGSGPGGVDGNGGGGTDPKPGPGDKTPGDTPPHGTPPHGDGSNPCELTNSCDGGPPKTFGPQTDDGPGDIVPGGDLRVGGVPEPATWLMLIVGFMGVGAALRVQRRKAALA
jgi:hypothetical protein